MVAYEAPDGGEYAMLSAYIEAAMSHATCKVLDESGQLFCEIPGLAGVWSVATPSGDGLRELQEVLEDWIELGLSMHHELPEVDGININVSRAAGIAD